MANNTGFTIIVGTPLVQTGGVLEILNNDISDSISTWSHEITSTIGYDKAVAAYNPTIPEYRDWIVNGLGRHVAIISPGLKQIWEGFVNRITISFGSVSRTIGPLLDISNSVNMEYTRIFPDSDIPLHGIETETGFVNNTDSQALYGIFSSVINGGSVSDQEATQMVNRYLAEHAFPTVQENFQYGRSAPFSMRLDLLGYYHWLFYDYADTGTGTINLSDKLIAVLGADPNGILSTDYSNIDSNTTQVVQNEDNAREAKSIISTLLLTSDSTYNKYVFGIYNDRIAHYNQIASAITVDYFIHSNDPAGKIVGSQDEEIEPWDVEVGKWMYTASENLGKSLSSDTLEHKDPSLHFVEKIKFNLPLELVINSGKVVGIDTRFATKTMLSFGRDI